MLPKSIKYVAFASLTALLASISTHAIAQEQILKFATVIPETNPYTVEFFAPLVAEINAAAEGEFEIQLYHNTTLASAANVWERVSTGVADMGWSAHGNVGLPFPKSTITALPGLIDDPEAGTAAFWQLYEDGLIADEYTDVKLLALAAFPVQLIHSSRPVRVLEDMTGLKTRGADLTTVQAIQALGGSPVSVSSPEMYQAFSQGIIDAAITNWTTITPFHLDEVAPYHTTGISLGATPGFIIINTGAYDRLSEKGKQVIDTYAGMDMSMRFGRAYLSIANRIEGEVLATSGQELIELSPEESARWQETLNPLQQSWVDATPDGATILEAFKASYAANSGSQQ